MVFTRQDAEKTNGSYSEISADFCKYAASSNTITEGGYVENTDYTKANNDLTFVRNSPSGTKERPFRYVCAEAGGTIEVKNSRGQMVQKTLVAGVVRPLISSTIGENTTVDVVVYF